MNRVNRRAVKVFEVDGKIYRTASSASIAFADALAIRLDTRHGQYGALGDADVWNDRYDAVYKKAKRRALPIFRKFFEQNEVSY